MLHGCGSASLAPVGILNDARDTDQPEESAEADEAKAPAHSGEWQKTKQGKGAEKAQGRDVDKLDCQRRRQGAVERSAYDTTPWRKFVT